MLKRVDGANVEELQTWKCLHALTPEFHFIALQESDEEIHWQEDTLSCYEVVYVREGDLILRLPEGHVRGTRGGVFVVPPNVAHREETPEGGTARLLCLGAAFLDATGARTLYPLPLARYLPLAPGHPAEWNLRRILTEVYRQAPGHSAIVAACITTLFGELARETAKIVVEPADVNQIRKARLVDEARFYIENHYAEPLTVEQIAQHFFYTPEAFGRVFRILTGTTPAAYLRQVRMEEAKRLLRDAEKSVKQVAAAVGFSDPHHFSRVFARYEGISPTLYRSYRLTQE